MLKVFGNDLKLHREKLKISLPEISAQTRINEVFLKKLENGDFSFNQEIYIRAFIREYANAVDLDPSEVIKDYELAKMGDYKSKFAVEEKKEETPGNKKEEKDNEKKEEIAEDDKKENKKEELKQDPEVKESDKKPEKKAEVKSKPKEEETPKEKTDGKKRVRITPDKPPEPEVKKSTKKLEPVSETISPPPVKKVKTFENGDKGQSSALKRVGFFLLSVLILIGLYFMVKAIFFDEGGSDGPEIVRQKFDDVVKENERKILGKRTDEEIRDSIRKAEEEQQRLIEQNLDTMELTINSIRSGSVIVVEDSANIDNPEKISFTGNQYGIWKATRSFLITSPNTSTFTVELNGQKIDIKEKNVKNYLISRKDLQDTTKTEDQSNNGN